MERDRSVAVIGLGSRGLGVLERIVSLSRIAGAQAGPVRVEVIDPVCDGAGVHAPGQPDYLLLNTTCGQVSMFPDRHTVGSYVDITGPDLHEWVTARGLRIAEDGYTVGPFGRVIRPTDFLPRRVLGEYLGWVLGEVLRHAPPHVSITMHQASAVDLSPQPEGDLRIELSDGTEVRTGAAFLTTGYTGNTGSGTVVRRIGEPYPLPGVLDRVLPGETLAISGFGLSAMDVMSAYTVGRGGRFVPDGTGLRYLPSGREPRLLFYSRSGLPCRARPEVVVFGPRYRPLVFTEAAVDAARARRGGPLDLTEDVLPLVFTELRIAYRRRVAAMIGHGAVQALEARLSADVESTLDQLDREQGSFDAAATFDGSAGMLLDDAASYEKWLANVLVADLAEGRAGFAGSPVKSALDILRDLRDLFRYVVDFGGVTPASLDEFTERVVPAINRAVVGPQFERHVELLALLAAGIARAPFGPAPVARQVAGGRWRISSTALAEPYESDVDWMLAAQVPQPAVATSASPLLESLYRKGLIRPHQPPGALVPGIDIDPGQHPLTADGVPERRIQVLGPLCEGATFYNNLVPSPNTWSRPVADAHRCVAALLAAWRAEPLEVTP